jgi:hypothetical protein
MHRVAWPTLPNWNDAKTKFIVERRSIEASENVAMMRTWILVLGTHHYAFRNSQMNRTVPRRDWTRDELIVAFNLYCKIPFGRTHIRNPLVIELAKALGRTPSAVSWKLAISRDLTQRCKKGISQEPRMAPGRKWKSGTNLAMTGIGWPLRVSVLLASS